MNAGASDRKIYRLISDNRSYIGVYNENKNENLAFINFTSTFKDLGFNVPDILNVSEDNLSYIEEDLGDVTLHRMEKDSKDSRPDELLNFYKHSLSDLIKFQILSKDKIDYNYCYQTKQFDREVISSDLHKFKNYFSKLFPQLKINEPVILKIIDSTAEIVAGVKSNFFLYRDFQPRNIMIKDNTLHYIDYQSGRRGPLQYDVASFLYSGSINLNDQERSVLLDHYMNELNSYIIFNKNEFLRDFYYFVFLRMLQVLGSYADLHEKRNDMEVLEKIPKALQNIKSIIDKIEDKEIRKFIVELVIE